MRVRRGDAAHAGTTPLCRRTTQLTQCRTGTCCAEPRTEAALKYALMGVVNWIEERKKKTHWQNSEHVNIVMCNSKTGVPRSLLWMEEPPRIWDSVFISPSW